MKKQIAGVALIGALVAAGAMLWEQPSFGAAPDVQAAFSPDGDGNPQGCYMAVHACFPGSVKGYAPWYGRVAGRKRTAGACMRRKRRQRDRALMLAGACADVVGLLVGQAKTAARKHGCSFADDSGIDAVLEAAEALGIGPSDTDIESAANRLLGRKRIDEQDPTWHCWHLY
ncbi:hypothetical protein [Paraburkholderia sp. RL17-337-BIB-A]|uniref:hypothetical protein n=1 Tax=Paraburkholderia sp. RL17-337-BIB-A TaxID=3031636 RepID=UPI0038B6C344